MGVILPEKNKSNKRRWLLLLALLLLISNIVFFIWYLSAPSVRYYQDSDKDGYGDNLNFKDAKFKPWGFVKDSMDVNDNNPCIPDSISQACIKIKEPTKTPGTSNGTTGKGIVFNCPDLGKNIGDPCTDNDENTINDKIDIDCNCIGDKKDVKKKKLYYDGDGDGFGDPNGEKEFAVDDNPSDYISNNKDACPRRPGPQSNKGCPTIEIQDLQDEIYVDEDFDVEIKAYDALPGDNINWAISKGTVLLQGQNKTSLRPSEPGLATVQVGVNNPTDGFKDTDSGVICIQYRKETLEKWINDKLKVIGNYSENNNVPSSQKREADMFRQKLLEVASPDIQIIENGIRWGGNLGAFIDAKFLTKGSFVKQVSISTPQSQLFNKSTGKIDKISFIITR